MELSTKSELRKIGDLLKEKADRIGGNNFNAISELNVETQSIDFEVTSSKLKLDLALKNKGSDETLTYCLRKAGKKK